MERKYIIKRIIIIAAWLLVISGITTLLIAANKKHEVKVCSDVVIGIRGGGDQFYVEESDILLLLEKAAAGRLVQKPVREISLEALEQALIQDKWIKNANLYFDREDVLHVLVEERQPVARVFTVNGNSFYIDSSGARMPLLEKLSARVPLITGFTPAVKFNAKDSQMLHDVKKVATFIYHHPFWNAQAGQIDISKDGHFEIIPVIGDHVIRIGEAEGIEDKLERLLLFYKRVLAKTGFNKYSSLDVRFNGQVVGVHKGTTSVVDSVQLQKNINELLEKSNLQNLTSEMLPSSQGRNNASSEDAGVVYPNPYENPQPVKQKSLLVHPSSPEKTKEKSSVEPKAVMPGNNRRSG